MFISDYSIDEQEGYIKNNYFKDSDLSIIHKTDSKLIKKIKEKLNLFILAKLQIIEVNEILTNNFIELKNILESRYELSRSLEEFNESTKNIITQNNK